MVPVGQARPDKGVPPLVRAAENIKLARQKTLRELGDVEAKRDPDKTVKNEDPGKKYLDLLTVESMKESPVQGGDKPIDGERDKIDESEDDVLVLVHLVEEHCPSHDKSNHSSHVDCAG